MHRNWHVQIWLVLGALSLLGQAKAAVAIVVTGAHKYFSVDLDTFQATRLDDFTARVSGSLDFGPDGGLYVTDLLGVHRVSDSGDSFDSVVEVGDPFAQSADIFLSSTFRQNGSLWISAIDFKSPSGVVFSHDPKSGTSSEPQAQAPGLDGYYTDMIWVDSHTLLGLSPGASPTVPSSIWQINIEDGTSTRLWTGPRLAAGFMMIDTGLAIMTTNGFVLDFDLSTGNIGVLGQVTGIGANDIKGVAVVVPGVPSMTAAVLLGLGVLVGRQR